MVQENAREFEGKKKMRGRQARREGQERIKEDGWPDC